MRFGPFCHVNREGLLAGCLFASWACHGGPRIVGYYLDQTTEGFHLWAPTNLDLFAYGDFCRKTLFYRGKETITIVHHLGECELNNFFQAFWSSANFSKMGRKQDGRSDDVCFWGWKVEMEGPAGDTPWLQHRCRDMSGRWHFTVFSLDPVLPIFSLDPTELLKQHFWGHFVGHSLNLDSFWTQMLFPPRGTLRYTVVCRCLVQKLRNCQTHWVSDVANDGGEAWGDVGVGGGARMCHLNRVVFEMDISGRGIYLTCGYHKNQPFM